MRTFTKDGLPKHFTPIDARFIQAIERARAIGLSVRRTAWLLGISKATVENYLRLASIRDGRIQTLTVSVKTNAPRWANSEMIEEMVSEAVVLLLSRRVTNTGTAVKLAVKKISRQVPSKFGPRSLDAPVFDDGITTLGDTLIG